MVDEVTTSGAGTFAFLFTDIEGSTALAEKLEDYPTRLDRLKRFVSETVAPHSGAVLDMTGDATLSAFKRAGDALRAAVDIQVGGASLTDEQGQLRIGIHVGKAASYKSVWSGVGINHTNRICTAGHGGQILLSAAARVLVEEHLPEGIGLLDIGQHHLKDLAGPQRLFQVTHPALRSNFPRLRTLEFLPNNLPKMLTSFVGRENELSDIKRRMKEARLLTVLGPGGVGKSRLALQVGAEMLNDFDSGVWVVLLAPLTESHLVPQAIAEALAVAEGAGRGLTEAIVEHIGKSSLLLILDNCEHLTSAVAGAVHDLLQQCPNLKVLATSRHVLALQGEALHRIEPLPLPAEDASPDAALHAPAMELLLDRARLVAPNLDLESGSVTYLQDICRRLEGIPLAIELAVPLLKTLSPSDLLSRLNDRLAVLKGGTSSERRHETLFATIDWGHDLLSESERLLFRRISVFPGSFSLETAEEVCASGDLPAQQVFDLVNLLVDKSLVSVEEGPRFRFYLLDTIADYARVQLRDAGEEDEYRNRHAHFFASWVITSLHGEDVSHKEDYDAISLESANIRSALEWLLTHDPSVALRLSGQLGAFWVSRGHWAEGRLWLERALENALDASPEDRARGLRWAAKLAFMQADHEAQEELTALWLDAARQTADTREILDALHELGWARFYVGKYDAARDELVETIQLAETLGDLRTCAEARRCIAQTYQLEGDLDAFMDHMEAATSLARAAGEPSTLQAALDSLGRALMDSDPKRAMELFTEELQSARSSGNTSYESFALMHLGKLSSLEGDSQGALNQINEAIRVATKHGDLIPEWAARYALFMLEPNPLEEMVRLGMELIDTGRKRGQRNMQGLALLQLAKRIAEESSPHLAARLLGAAKQILGKNTTVLGGPTRAAELIGDIRKSIKANTGDQSMLAEEARGAVTSVEDLLAELYELLPPVGGSRWLVSEGEVWAVTFDGLTRHLKDSRGIRYLATLIGSPDQEFSALQLASPAVDPDSRGKAGIEEGLAVGGGLGDAGEVLDKEAIDAYRRRLTDLESELDEATSFNDLERAARLQSEIHFLQEELSAAVGLRGSPRKAVSAQERARVAVTRSIRQAIKRVRQTHPAMAAHLDASIATGNFCIYRPSGDEPSWKVVPASDPPRRR